MKVVNEKDQAVFLLTISLLVIVSQDCKAVVIDFVGISFAEEFFKPVTRQVIQPDEHYEVFVPLQEDFIRELCVEKVTIDLVTVLQRSDKKQTGMVVIGLVTGYLLAGHFISHFANRDYIKVVAPVFTDLPVVLLQHHFVVFIKGVVTTVNVFVLRQSSYEIVLNDSLEDDYS